MAKFVTDTSGATWWPNLEPKQVAFFLLAGEITQVKEAIPWVRCASGNVSYLHGLYTCFCVSRHPTQPNKDFHNLFSVNAAFIMSAIKL